MELHENRTELERLLAHVWEYDEEAAYKKTNLPKWLFALTLAGALICTFSPADIASPVMTALAPAPEKLLIDKVASENVAEDLDYGVARHTNSVAGWRAFLDAHPHGPHAEAARAETERLQPGSSPPPEPSPALALTPVNTAQSSPPSPPPVVAEEDPAPPPEPVEAAEQSPPPPAATPTPDDTAQDMAPPAPPLMVVAEEEPAPPPQPVEAAEQTPPSPAATPTPVNAAQTPPSVMAEAWPAPPPQPVKAAEQSPPSPAATPTPVSTAETPAANSPPPVMAEAEPARPPESIAVVTDAPLPPSRPRQIAAAKSDQPAPAPHAHGRPEHRRASQPNVLTILLAQLFHRHGQRSDVIKTNGRSTSKAATLLVYGDRPD